MNTIYKKKFLYPRIDTHRLGRLSVSDIHELYWEESGNPDGLPVVALHGGPGGGSNPDMRRFFDPDKYRIIIFDQRGCGRSSPFSELQENTTWDLVEDMEKLRNHLKVDKWLLFGGSWGSTLALAYAAKHRSTTLGLILRGIFLLTESEIRWFYQEGASRLFPDAYDKYVYPIPKEERHDLVQAFYERLIGNKQEDREAAAKAWSQWEGETLSIRGPSMLPTKFEEQAFVDAFARIECHYFWNKGFFEKDGWLLDQAKTFGNLPGVLVHGRYDVVTPISSAWALKKAWPAADLKIIGDAGHSSMEPGIIHELINATELMAEKFSA